MITLVVPAYSAGPNLERTIDSCRAVCDDVVIVSTAPYLHDTAEMMKLGSVVELPWNYVMGNGFGALHNEAAPAAKNDWILLLGVAETLAEEYRSMKEEVSRGMANAMLRCDHVNDPNTWKRLYNRKQCRWSGIIHEEVTGGEIGDVVFRMQDTEKTPPADSLHGEVFRFIKSVLYHSQYRRLRLDNSLLGAASPGWIKFVNGSREANEAFCTEHEDMIDACRHCDFPLFQRLVEERMQKCIPATGVNFTPQGHGN